MGAYYIVSGAGCQVITAAAPGSSGWSWNPQAQPGFTYGVAQWNKLYPSYFVPCPSNCPGCVAATPAPPPPGSPPTPPPPAPPPVPAVPPPSQPPTQTPPPKPQGPITGPPDPNPCAPGMSQRNDSKRLGFTTQEHLLMPRNGEFHAVRHGNLAGLTAEPPTTTGASYMKAPDVRVMKSGGIVTVADLGTGDGYMVFHPSDINEFGLRGDSVHPDGAWPQGVSRVALLLLNATRNAATTGQHAKTYLAFGKPTARPEARGKPASGVYFDYDPATGVLNIQHTTALAADTSVTSGLKMDGETVGNVIGPGSATVGNLAQFNNVNGKVISDSGVVAANVVNAANNITSDAIVRGDGGAKGVKGSPLILSDITGGARIDTADDTVSGSDAIELATGDGGEVSSGGISIDVGDVTGAGVAGSIDIAKQNALNVNIGNGATVVRVLGQEIVNAPNNTAALEITSEYTGDDPKRGFYPDKAFSVAGANATIATVAVAANTCFTLYIRATIQNTTTRESQTFEGLYNVEDIGGTVLVTAIRTEVFGGSLATQRISVGVSKAASPVNIVLVGVGVEDTAATCIIEKDNDLNS